VIVGASVSLHWGQSCDGGNWVCFWVDIDQPSAQSDALVRGDAVPPNSRKGPDWAATDQAHHGSVQEQRVVRKLPPAPSRVWNDWVSHSGWNKKWRLGEIKLWSGFRRRDQGLECAHGQVMREMTFDRFNPLTMLMAPDHNPFSFRIAGRQIAAPRA